ncbi:MAG: 4-alpha-glucanotransferase [Actinomycetota bacterium]|nr:4-alpha-glucanotransferase [Actinomycetota bacterium]
MSDAPSSLELSPELADLAAAYGVATEYSDWRGRHVQVSGATIHAVLAALGIDTSTSAATAAALEDRLLSPWRRLLPPCVVTTGGREAQLLAHVPAGEPIEVLFELEDGGRRADVPVGDAVEVREVDGRRLEARPLTLPADLALGWHRLRLTAGTAVADAPLAVTPAYLGAPPALGDERAWGFMTQLYQVRSARSWGLGDLADLADLAGWSGHELGAGFVLVNPLHAAEPVGPMEPSPYLPATRRFVNPVYSRVEAIPEYAYLPPADRTEVERLAARQRAVNSRDERLDRDAVWAAKRAALERVFAVPRSLGRQAAYAAFVEREGPGLEDFTTWCALAEQHGLPWREWPADLHDPGSPAVARARVELAGRVDFWRWLQWTLDEQLAAAQRGAREAGMPLGVVHDLAVGVSGGGADAWSLQDVLALGVSVGAPPDAFNQQGQDWAQPPWRPDRLAEVGYAPYRDMIRTVLRHAGGVRVDHVMGLFRLWWTPHGMAPQQGTYVRLDHEAMVGILALEADRAGALVVGEDLGNVEPWVRDHLRQRGILGTSILWFERDWDADRPLRPEEWRELALATVTTHDLPPTAGYLSGEHIRIRAELGLLERPVEEERAQDAAEIQSWRALLAELGLLAAGGDERTEVEALHRYLARTPARLLGVQLADAAGERRAINQPGTSDEYPNWRLPLTDGAGQAMLLEELVSSVRARALAAVMSEVPTSSETTIG